MKTKLFLLPLLFCLSSLKSIAQDKLYVGIELGPRREDYIFNDPHGLLYKKEYPHALYGISVAYELNKKYTFESGLYSNPIADDENFVGSRFRGYSNPDRATQIPLRLKRTLIPLGNRLQLNGIIGVSYSYFGRANCPTGVCFTGSAGTRSRTTADYFETKRYAVEKHIWLGEVGASLTYKLRPKLNLDITYSYYQGLKPITRTYAEYYKEGNPILEADFYSKGSSTNLLFRLSYHLFDFSKSEKQSEEYYKN